MYVYGACTVYVFCSDCVGICGNVCCVAAVIGVLKYVVCLCKSCDGWYVMFCLYCEAWSCMCLVYGKCECFGHADCCMFVSCVHPVAVLNAAFCMT